MNVVVLAGGFGGARMAHGFALLGDAIELAVVVNTADDLELHGLHISPDLDTLMYTLAGLASTETGWGVRDETWSAAEMLARYGEPTWFRLGDRDLATHIVRTARLHAGASLTAATAELAAALGVRARLLPMTDERVRTKLRTADGWLDFQDYFVRRHHEDDVAEIRFDGVESARPTQAVIAALESADLVVVAPSNPFVSVAPILALDGVADALRSAPARVVAVSPIVGGASVRGPAAALLRSLAGDAGAAGVARHYARAQPGLIDVFVIDNADSAEADGVRQAGFTGAVEQTIMAGEADRRALAGRLITLA